MSAYPVFHDGRIREPGVYADTAMVFDLDSELRSLYAEQPWQADHTAKTIVKYPDMRIVLVAMKAGARLAPHDTMARISIQTVTGYLRVRIPGKRISLPAGSMLALERGVIHEVSAPVDSAFLLTIAWPAVSHCAVRPQPALFRSASIREAVEPAVMQFAQRAQAGQIRIDAPHSWRESGLDKTLADTFPCSDALSSIPDPKMTTA